MSIANSCRKMTFSASFFFINVLIWSSKLSFLSRQVQSSFSVLIISFHYHKVTYYSLDLWLLLTLKLIIEIIGVERRVGGWGGGGMVGIKLEQGSDWKNIERLDNNVNNIFHNMNEICCLDLKCFVIVYFTISVRFVQFSLIAWLGFLQKIECKIFHKLQLRLCCFSLFENLGRL